MSRLQFRLFEGRPGPTMINKGPLGELHFSSTFLGADGGGSGDPPTDYCGCGFSYILLAEGRFRVGGVHEIEVPEQPRKNRPHQGEAKASPLNLNA